MYLPISIHAPSRERRNAHQLEVQDLNFNPRSLTGATIFIILSLIICLISIHAPSRERHCCHYSFNLLNFISIHAPSRERRHMRYNHRHRRRFQSTLPHGSDRLPYIALVSNCVHFNPRSLTGATGVGYCCFCLFIFQSTLPHGSDYVCRYHHKQA